MTVPVRLVARGDFYNTDRGRPLQIEDAYTIERYAFDLQLAPLRLDRARREVYKRAAEPSSPSASCRTRSSR